MHIYYIIYLYIYHTYIFYHNIYVYILYNIDHICRLNTYTFILKKQLPKENHKWLEICKNSVVWHLFVDY